LGRRSASSTAVDSRTAAFAAANASEVKKGKGTVVLDVRQVTVLAEYFVITGGDSPSQVKAIVEAVDEKLVSLGCKAIGIEGKSESRWVLLDYGDVIVHVLHEKERGYYKLEQFWNQALMVDRQEWEQEE
jgi:ribosome-associated protein